MKKISALSITAITIAAICLIIACSMDNTLMTDENLANDNVTTSADMLYSDLTWEELPECNFKIVSTAPLTEVEVEMLKYVREEEKMAHDVYYVLSEIYKKPIFKNIMKSEQNHMDKVWCLLIHFNVEDPASDEIGKFTNDEIQELYNYLVDLGTKNIIDGLTAGAIIEDYDIYDIEHWMSQTDNEAIISVFSNIVCGSGNHLISFTRLLDGFDIEYIPEYITSDEYQDILDAGSQLCGL